LGPHDSRIVLAAQRRHYRDNKTKTHGRNMSAMMVMKAGKTATPTDIINFTRERIAGFKTPKSVDFTEALPRNAGQDFVPPSARPVLGGQGPAGEFDRHCEERKRRSNPACGFAKNYFAEPVIGRRFAPTRWLAMTVTIVVPA
jgi:hypothetical protein